MTSCSTRRPAPRVGHAHIDAHAAALARLGQYSLDVEQQLLDGKWQYWQMRPRQQHESPHSAALSDLLDLPRPRTAEARISRQCRRAIARSTMQPELAVLDRDEEFFAWYGRYRDFHPALPAVLQPGYG